MHRPPIEVGLAVGSGPTLRRSSAMVRIARLLGVRSVWMVDHLVGFFPASVWDRSFTWLAGDDSTPDEFYDWQVLAGGLARRAGSLQLGVGVTEAIRRHPVVLAQAALTLSHMTRTPPILGLGSGEAENVVPYGLDFERPVSRLEEALSVIRMCLDGPGPHTFAGEFFQLDQAMLALRPGRGGKPLVWVGAHGPRMLELTGRFADGWLPAVPMSPEAYAAALARIRNAASLAGRDGSAIVPAMSVPIVIGRGAADIAHQLGHPAVRFLALLAPARLWRSHGLDHPLGPEFGGMSDFIPSRYGRSEVEAAIGRVPPALLQAALIAGTPQEVVSQIGSLVDAGLRHVVLSPVSPLVSRSALATTVGALPSIIRRLRGGEPRRRGAGSR